MYITKKLTALFRPARKNTNKTHNASNEEHFVENSATAADDSLYVKLLNATIAATSETAVRSMYPSVNNKWEALCILWGKLFPGEPNAVFTEAFHSLHWGFMRRQDYSASFVYLVNLVKGYIVERNIAADIWFLMDTVKKCIEYVVEETMPLTNTSNIYCTYISHHFYLKSRTYADYVPGSDRCYSSYADYYEYILARLIPESINWDTDKWIDDSTVTTSMDKLYGIDYSECPENFERLIELLLIKWCDGSKKDVLWYTMAMTELPDSIASKIWPSDTQRTLELLFLTCFKKVHSYHTHHRPHDKDIYYYFHPTKCYNAAFLKNSWLYKRVCSWVDAGTCCSDLEEDIKNAIGTLSTYKPQKNHSNEITLLK